MHMLCNSTIGIGLQLIIKIIKLNKISNNILNDIFCQSESLHKQHAWGGGKGMSIVGSPEYQ